MAEEQDKKSNGDSGGSENIEIPPISKQTAGAAAGAVIGSVAGPIGAVVGGVLGALAGRAAASGKPILPAAKKTVTKARKKVKSVAKPSARSSSRKARPSKSKAKTSRSKASAKSRSSAKKKSQAVASVKTKIESTCQQITKGGKGIPRETQDDSEKVEEPQEQPKEISGAEAERKQAAAGKDRTIKKWAGLDSNQRRRKASRFTVCSVWPLRNLPVVRER